MPFSSRRQQRAAFAGLLPGLDKAKAKEWAEKTDFSVLPERAASQKGQPTLRSKVAGFSFLVDSLGEAFKSAALGTSVSAVSRNVGKFKGFATTNALKPPGRAPSMQALNPRRSLHNAMNAFKA